jgi:hypothetical protein
MEIEKVLARSQCLLLGPAFRLDLVYIGRLVKRIRPRLSFGGMLVTKGVKIKGVKIGPICRHSKVNLRLQKTRRWCKFRLDCKLCPK